MFQKHLSSAHIIAIVALFVALGGTALAATTLPRNSVGPPQIRTDAVRSPEIEKDAVRSSEIRDESINFGDVSSGAATKLRGDLHVAKDDNDSQNSVPECGGVDLSVCPNFLALELGTGAASEPGRNWLVQAKAGVLVEDHTAVDDKCGLVNTALTGPRAVLDEAPVGETAETGKPIPDDIALSAVVKKRAGNPTIALRCTRQEGPVNGLLDEVTPSLAKITALEVGAVTGP